MAKLCLVVVALFGAVQGSVGCDAVLVLYSSRLDLLTEADFGALTLQLGLPPAVNLRLILRDLNTSSCEQQETKAVSAFIEEVLVNRTNGSNVVATVGPSCTDSAYAVARLSGRREVSMVHLHTSPLPAPLAAQLGNSS